MVSTSNERDPLLKHNQARSRKDRTEQETENVNNGAFRSPSHSPSRSPSRSPSSPSTKSSSSSDQYSTQKPNPLYILPLNFFNAFGWSLIEVPLIYLLRTRICELQFGDKPGSLPYESDKCRSDSIQVSVSAIRAGFQTIAAVLGLLTTTSYGALSDSHGRRKVLLICSVFQFVGDLSLLIVVVLPGYTNPYYILIAAVFKGFGGYISAIVAGQNSYVADCTTPENRSRYLGWNFATYHLGTAMGPLISGVLVAKRDRMDLVYTISASLWAIYFLYTFFILPESNPPQKITETSSDNASIMTEDTVGDTVLHWLRSTRHLLFVNFIEPLTIVLPSKTKSSYDFLGSSTEAKRHWDVCIAAVLIGLTLFSTGSMGMLPLYTDYKLAWGPLKASLLMSVDAGASALTLTFVFPATCWIYGQILKRFGGIPDWQDLAVAAPWNSSQDADQPPSNFNPSVMEQGQAETARRNSDVMSTSDKREELSKKITVVKRDLWVARTGYFAAALAVSGVALATTDFEMYLSIVVQSLSNIALPAVQSIALNGVRPDYNGRILAGFAIVESLALVVRGPVFAGIYNLSLKTASNAIYWTSAGVYLLCLALLSFVKLYRPLGDR